ncbi:hypothetical protein A3206_06970 [Candidatus Methanomassiliicoccus intestinalis]|uniref:Oxidoreductase n=1 Tax=Methanomassiliicoccus intestinalis (strain Issoire-Mx1) TaxID=1295009 RepID=R9T9A2_METII|nr:SDR family NAD(P)-dependent oxidoreductase [Candidatus Methanomassiliicoccus intestinalis]AGN25963.1 oxidoreductase [Candidatus Methanomassiliicoccus intestinalis Issoire-Mx1]TQS83373.1 MAG: hypothetical protein A3206_06970 [Candidatus Methanomassiliicoccus intestinalis]
MGLAIARKLKSMGMNVVVFDIQNPPDGFEFYCVDIRDDTQIKEALLQISNVYILVNNAKVYFEKYLEDTTNDDIDKMVDINKMYSFKIRLFFFNVRISSSLAYIHLIMPIRNIYKCRLKTHKCHEK